MFKVQSVFLVVLLLQLYSTNGQTVTLEPLAAVNEGSTFTACFTISEAPASDTGLVVNVQNNTPDISEVNQDLTFASGTTELTQCIDGDIEALLDDRVENIIETVPAAFTVELFEGGVSIGTQDVGVLMILDMPTSRTVKFEQSSYILSEGSQLNTVCVSINGFIDSGSFSVDLEYTGVTATLVDDFTEGSVGVSFSSTTVDQMECVTVTASDDELVEGLETFTIAMAVVGSSAGILVIDTEMDTANVTILDINSNCGSPPEGEGVQFTISDSQSVAGELVVDLDAVATYSCVMEGYVIEDANTLTCVSVNNTAQWYPAEALVCEQGAPAPTTPAPTTPAPTTTTTSPGVPTDTDGLSSSNTNRNIAIGVGVGVGGALLLILLVLLVVFIIVRVKKGKRHSKYVLNYNTVYGSENRPSQQNDYATTSAAVASAAAAPDAGGEDVPDAGQRL